jgi:hypothetical protein
MSGNFGTTPDEVTNQEMNPEVKRPEKPQQLDEDGICQVIREQVGFDPSYLYKDSEVDEAGMRRELNIDTEMQV